MAKHKSKKKVIKKRVQKRAAKLKELTAQDLLMNPELLHSPQFKALPLEKQFQLTSQLKQLRMMSRGGLGAPVPSSTSGDNSLYHQLMSLLNKNSRLESDNTQTQKQINAEKARNKELYETNKQIRKQESQNKKELKNQEELDKANERLAMAQADSIKTQAQIVNQQTQEIYNEIHAKERMELERHLVKNKQRLKRLNKQLGFIKPPPPKKEPKEYKDDEKKSPPPIIEENPPPLNNDEEKPSSPIIESPNDEEQATSIQLEGEERKVIEQLGQEKAKTLDLQDKIVNQIEALSSSGEKEKAMNVEHKWKQHGFNIRFATGAPFYSDESEEAEQNEPKEYKDDDDKKKESDESETLITPTEIEAIETNDELEDMVDTFNEQINKREELLKLQKENIEANERAQAENNYKLPVTESDKYMLKQIQEETKRDLNTLMAQVKNPNPGFRDKFMKAIDGANSSGQVAALRNVINQNYEFQETAVKQQNYINEGKEILTNIILKHPNKYGFTMGIWKAKIEQIHTLEQVRDVKAMMKKAKKAVPIINNIADNTQDKVKEATENMAEVQKFLHSTLPDEKDTVFIDTRQNPNISPELQKITPSLNYKFVDISNYDFDPRRDSLPNKLLLNGINIMNIKERYHLSPDKLDFITKLALFAAQKGVTVVFYLVKYGTKVLIAALSNESIAKAALTGGALFAFKSLWKGKPSQNELMTELSNADTEQIIDLVDEGNENELSKQIGKRIEQGDVSPEEVAKFEKSMILLHEEKEKREKEKKEVKNKLRWKAWKRKILGERNLFPSPEQQQYEHMAYSDPVGMNSGFF